MADTKDFLIPSLPGKSAVDLQAMRQKNAEMSLRGAKGHSDEEIGKAASQFEALLLQQMMTAMWKAVPNEGLLSGSREEALYRDMLNQAVAENIANGRSIGVKDVVMKELQKTEKK